MKSEEPANIEAVQYDVPILQGRQDDGYHLEVLLLAWTLLLHRQSNGNHVEYSWGLCDVENHTCRTFGLSTSSLSFSRTDSVSVVLDSIRNYLRELLPSESPVAVDRYTLVLTDERAASDTFYRAKDNGKVSIDWVSPQAFDVAPGDPGHN